MTALPEVLKFHIGMNGLILKNYHYQIQVSKKIDVNDSIKYRIDIKKEFNYPKTTIDFFNNNKKITILSFSSIGGGRKYVQKNEFYLNLQKSAVHLELDVIKQMHKGLMLVTSH